MKKVFAIVCALTLLVSLLAGCGGAASGSDNTSSAATGSSAAAGDSSAAEEKPAGWWKEELATVTDGVLTVATSPDFAPYEFYAIDENGNAQLAGFDMSLAQYIADYMGLTLEVIPMDFDGVLAEVTAGNVDLGMAGLSPDPDRMDAMDFSDIYYQGGQSLVTVQANKDKWSSLADLNDASLSIGAQLGSIQYNLAMENTPDADIVTLAKVTDVIADLLGEKLDAAFIETVVAQSYQKNYPDLYIAFDADFGQVCFDFHFTQYLRVGLHLQRTCISRLAMAVYGCITNGSYSQQFRIFRIGKAERAVFAAYCSRYER